TSGGASGPLTFAVTAGSLPNGLQLSTSGFLDGTPTQGGTFSFTITATDSDGDQENQAYTLNLLVPTAITVNGPSSLVFGQSATSTATLIELGGPNPLLSPSDGTVTFYDNGKSLGTVGITGTINFPSTPSTATLANVALTGGLHSISASYSGNS